MYIRTLTTILLGTLFLVGCNSEPDATKPLTLKIVHINDHLSHLNANNNVDLEIANVKIRVVLGGFPRVVEKIKELADSNMPVVRIHAGNAISGDLYYSLFAGEADAALMNEACFDIFALGNHEFDSGELALKNFLDWLNKGGCVIDIVAANIKPKVGVSPLAKSGTDDYFKPFSIKTYNDEKVGFIGINPATKTKNSSSPDRETKFLDELKTAQKNINRLHKLGVNKIVLITQSQFKNDIAMAASLKGVDVIIGADSHTLLGNFQDLGLITEGVYPTKVVDANNNPVCIVQAWHYGAVVGELNVKWNANGVVEECSGTPHLLMADSFKRPNAEGVGVELEGSKRSSVLTELNKRKNVSILEGDVRANKKLLNYSAQVDKKKARVIGKATANLCLERIPGEGKSTVCDRSETMKHGSDIANIVTKAFRYMSKTSDIAIQNSGGVRMDISQGNITIGDAYTLLPFSNSIVELHMSGKEIKSVLEEALNYAMSEGGSTGSYPYASGLRWNVDLSQPEGSRFTKLEFQERGQTEWILLDSSRTYSVATNNYIARGKDGYKTFGDVTKDGRYNETYLDYAQSFVEYVRKVGSIDKPSADEYSTQVFIDHKGIKH